MKPAKFSDRSKLESISYDEGGSGANVTSSPMSPENSNPDSNQQQESPAMPPAAIDTINKNNTPKQALIRGMTTSLSLLQNDI
jgi:hypothetical protein